MKTLRVNFNDIDEDGLVRSHPENANCILFVGDQIFVYDGEGHTAHASVVSVFGNQVKVICLAQQLVAA